jgi:hypothetical protein
LSHELEETKGGLKSGGEKKSASRREMLSRRERQSATEAGFFLRSQTEFGSDDESSSPPWLGQEKDGHSQQLKFHGARPLGASGESSVSGPPQCGQLSTASGSVVFRTWLFSLLLVAESRCLAFCSS